MEQPKDEVVAEKEKKSGKEDKKAKKSKKKEEEKASPPQNPTPAFDLDSIMSGTNAPAAPTGGNAQPGAPNLLDDLMSVFDTPKPQEQPPSNVLAPAAGGLGDIFGNDAPNQQM